MSRTADQAELYRLEPLQPRILLSADTGAAVALDAEVGVVDTFATLECKLTIGGDDGGADVTAADDATDPAADDAEATVRFFKYTLLPENIDTVNDVDDVDASTDDADAPTADDEAFVDPDGVEYVQSDLYRTLDVPADADVEILTLDDGAPEGGMCGVPDSPWVDPGPTDDAQPTGILYAFGGAADDPEANLDDVPPDTAEVNPEIFEMHVTSVRPEAETDAGSATDQGDAVTAAPKADAAPAPASEANPLLTKNDDLLANGAELLA